MIDPGNDTTALFATEKPVLTPIWFKPILIYSSLPEWVKEFDINNWVETNPFLEIYELKKSHLLRNI